MKTLTIALMAAAAASALSIAPASAHDYDEHVTNDWRRVQQDRARLQNDEARLRAERREIGEARRQESWAERQGLYGREREADRREHHDIAEARELERKVAQDHAVLNRDRAHLREEVEERREGTRRPY